MARAVARQLRPVGALYLAQLVAVRALRKYLERPDSDRALAAPAIRAAQSSPSPKVAAAAQQLPSAR